MSKNWTKENCVVYKILKIHEAENWHHTYHSSETGPLEYLLNFKTILNYIEKVWGGIFINI